MSTDHRRGRLALTFPKGFWRRNWNMPRFLDQQRSFPAVPDITIHGEDQGGQLFSTAIRLPPLVTRTRVWSSSSTRRIAASPLPTISPAWTRQPRVQEN